MFHSYFCTLGLLPMVMSICMEKEPFIRKKNYKMKKSFRLGPLVEIVMPTVGPSIVSSGTTWLPNISYYMCRPALEDNISLNLFTIDMSIPHSIYNLCLNSSVLIDDIPLRVSNRGLKSWVLKGVLRR